MLHARTSRRRLLLPLALAVAAVGALAIDMPVARQCRTWQNEITPQQGGDQWHERNELVRFWLGWLDMFEPFGHGLGVVLVVVLLHQLDAAGRRTILRVLLCALAAGAAADVLKMLVMRIRPNDFELSRPVWATFERWLPLWGIDSTLQSFPSAHTATAVGLAAALIWRYPRGRCVFSLLAVLVGCQRVVSGAHYPSDVLLGAATGCLMAMFFLHVGRLPKWFDRWERGPRGAGALPAPEKAGETPALQDR